MPTSRIGASTASPSELTCYAEFNQCGELSYTIRVGEETCVKTVSTPQNYQLEVEQLSLCILGEGTPHVTSDFSVKNSRTLQRVLEAIRYF